MGKARRVTGFLLTLAVAVLVFLLLPTATVYRDWAFVCRNTGSTKGYREWFWGGTSGHWRKTSALEAFMAAEHPDELKHDWVSYQGTGYSVPGCATSSGHGMPGPITSTVFWIDLDAYVTSRSPQEKKALYDLFASGDEKAIREKLNEIALGTESRGARD